MSGIEEICRIIEKMAAAILLPLDGGLGQPGLRIMHRAGTVRINACGDSRLRD